MVACVCVCVCVRHVHPAPCWKYELHYCVNAVRLKLKKAPCCPRATALFLAHVCSHLAQRLARLSHRLTSSEFLRARVCVCVCVSESVYVCVYKRMCVHESAYVPKSKRVKHRDQHTAISCNTQQQTATARHRRGLASRVSAQSAVHCSTLQHTAAHCITLHYIVTHCSILQQQGTSEVLPVKRARISACSDEDNASDPPTL